MPIATKTGTTIVGVIYKDGVVLGADTRATSGDLIADKNCNKIHYLQPNMYCCGAGELCLKYIPSMSCSYYVHNYSNVILFY